MQVANLNVENLTGSITGRRLNCHCFVESGPNSFTLYGGQKNICFVKSLEINSTISKFC